MYQVKATVGQHCHIRTYVVIEGVHVGENAVVATEAVVIDDVPENTIVAGCPARVIKMKDEKARKKTKLENG